MDHARSSFVTGARNIPGRLMASLLAWLFSVVATVTVTVR